MSRQTKQTDSALIRKIDGISARKGFQKSSKWNKYIEGLMWQVVTRLKKPNHPFPKAMGWKKHESNWHYALIEIRRQEFRLLRKTLKMLGLTEHRRRR